jgi:hypothetical protein
MNTHYCKVGTVRPNLNKTLDSEELKNSSNKSKTKTKNLFNKLSK